MTTALPRWRGYAKDLGRIIRPTKDNATDPEYVAAYLTQLLDRARASANEMDADLRSAHLVGYLEGGIQNFALGLRMQTPSADAFAETLAERTGVRWTRLAGFVTTCGSMAAAVEVVKILGLKEVSREPDAVKWGGEVDGWPVTLFGRVEQ